MILDNLEHANLYKALGGGIAKALEIMATEDLAAKPLGNYEIDGERLVMKVQEYETKAQPDCKWEAHRRYIDVQYVVSGAEKMGRADLATMKERTPFDSAKDVGFYDGDGDTVHVPAGSFAIFYPDDAHMPGIAAGTPARVRKVVFKVEV